MLAVALSATASDRQVRAPILLAIRDARASFLTEPVKTEPVKVGEYGRLLDSYDWARAPMRPEAAPKRRKGCGERSLLSTEEAANVLATW